jgi:hypothetical protein
MNKINEPVKDFINKYYPDGDVTQYFGENPALYGHICNADKMCLAGHNGIDIVRAWGEDILSVEDGIVVDVKDTPDGFGKHIRVLSRGTNSEWTYGHLSNIYVRVGDEVKAEDVIGTMGNTGFVVSGSTPFWKWNPFAGTHLHLGRREIKFTERGWRYNNNTPRFEVLNYNNGFMGSVDFKNMLPVKRTLDEQVNLLWRSTINWLFQTLGILAPKFKIPHTLKQGDRNEHVKTLQTMLAFEGYFKQEATGFYGVATAKAVLQWQKHYEVDNVNTLNELNGRFFGPKSLSVMRRIYD